MRTNSRINSSYLWNVCVCNPHCRAPPPTCVVFVLTDPPTDCSPSSSIPPSFCCPSLPSFFLGFSVAGFDCQQWRLEEVNRCSTYPEVSLFGPDLLFIPLFGTRRTHLGYVSTGRSRWGQGEAEQWSGIVQAWTSAPCIVNKEILQRATAAASKDKICWPFFSGNLGFILKSDTDFKAFFLEIFETDSWRNLTLWIDSWFILTGCLFHLFHMDLTLDYFRRGKKAFLFCIIRHHPSRPRYDRIHAQWYQWPFNPSIRLYQCDPSR